MINENTIFSVMREVCNYFTRRDDVRCYQGTVTIDDEARISINVPSPYIIIRGSHKNDGLYFMDDEHQIHQIVFEEGDLHPVPETFEGRVWFSYPPQDFLALCNSIQQYSMSQDVTPMNVVSERFGSSSRTYSQGKNGGIVTWQESFGVSLRAYRKNMFEEIW